MESTSILALLFGALDGSVPRDLFNAEVAAADGLDLTGIDLNNYDLRGLTFRRCTLRDAKLNSVRADGVSFEQANLDGVELNNASLVTANFERASAIDSTMVEADMTGADLTWCVLRGSRLDGVDLGRATLWKTDLREAVYPDFAFRPDQDILHSQLERPLEGRVTLREFLDVVSGLSETSYKMPGSAPGPKVDIPENLKDDPDMHLATVARDLGLRVVPHVGPTGSIMHYEIVQ